MKKIEIFIGSPRKSGNTAVMADMLIKTISGKGASHTVNYLYDSALGPCLDCRRCTMGKMVCTVNDGMQELFDRIDQADIIVIGTPVYWYGPSAVTKLLLDRFRPYYRNKRLQNKTLELLLPAAEGSIDCDLTIEMFKRSAGLLGMHFAGAVTACAYEAGAVADDKEVQNAINELAARLIS